MISNFLREIIVDPLSKSELKNDFNKLNNDYGRSYALTSNGPDLRLFSNNISIEQKVWVEGQKEYEKWNTLNYLQLDKNFLEIEKELNAEMYTGIEFNGKNILDVGGGAGLFREFAKGYRNFVIVDPYEQALIDSRKSKNLVEVYPFLYEDVDFVIGFAEHLPFKSNVFDIVHIRSAIDHFSNPELALLEAYRVLTYAGTLIIGVSLEPANLSYSRKIKNKLKSMFHIQKDHDHHSWHPNNHNLRQLIIQSGFNITDERYQNVKNASIIYICATK
jgi:ubiquinone/menaquinone biosynthesis C-methylase UbiE